MALQVWLPLNKGNSTDFANKGISGVAITNNSATVLNDGKLGKCYNFGDGTSSTQGKGVNIASNLLDLGSKRSICAWVRPKGNHLHYTGVIVSSGNWNTANGRWSFGVKQDNSGFTGFDAGVNSYYSASIPVNQWTHLCVTVDGNTTKFYKNGIYLGESTRGSDFGSDASNTMIGRETYAGGYFSFNGDICDVRIYSHCLSAEEVKEISKGLVCHYKLDGVSEINSTNIFSSLTAGGQTTIDRNSVLTSAVNSDTYFTINLTESIVSGQTYTISCYADVPANTYWIFPLGNQNNTTLSFKIYPGYNVYTFTANSIDWGTNRIFMDDNGGTARSSGIPSRFYNFKICKGAAGSNVNLIKDGWGGTGNWIYDGSSYVSSTEIKSNIPGITHSYGANNETKEFIPIIHGHTYTLSAFMKSRSSSPSGTGYLVVVPYDADYKWIQCPMATGIRQSSLTTLAQPLKPGDTIIYATNLSGWTNPGTYQYYVAIFGYKNSEGYTYPDGTYTRRIYQYGTTTDKSHLDIANNRITLNSAYNGDPIPAGTAIALTGDGGTYYYPDYTSQGTEWKWLSGSFIPKNTPYMAYARYIRIQCMYGNLWMCGLTLTDDTANVVIKDNSGFGNDAVPIANITPSSDFVRYGVSLKNNEMYPLKATFSIPDFENGVTIACWMKLTEWGIQTSGLWSTSFDNVYPIDYQNSTCNHRDSGWDCKGTNGTVYRLGCSSDVVPLNTWKHVVFRHDGTNLKCFVNGVNTATTACPTGLKGFDYLYLGWSYAGGADRKCKGNWSDFRMYATALSDTDILDLYKTSGMIDNLANADFMEIVETTDSSTNIAIKAEYARCRKVFEDGLSRYQQNHCQETLTDDGYRIYRTPNLIYPDAGTVMWGGFVLDNTDNRFQFQKGHTYVLQFEIKGKTSNSVPDIYWTNYVGWGGGETQCSPSNISYANPVTADYNSNEWKTFTYKWTINDDVWKLCTSSYQSFVAGNYYVSYKGFKYGFSYTNTGSLGTDLYIKNIRMYDVTTNTPIEVKKTGIIEAVGFVEEDIPSAEFTKGGTSVSKGILEI